jgi:hypothetical protein
VALRVTLLAFGLALLVVIVFAAITTARHLSSMRAAPLISSANL